MGDLGLLSGVWGGWVGSCDDDMIFQQKGKERFGDVEPMDFQHFTLLNETSFTRTWEGEKEEGGLNTSTADADRA